MRIAPTLTLSVAALACVPERGPLINRMAQSGTHYLASAARQPVSWQPWGREAFALATRLDRPVLLYVGADGCRWCAVMDREVYADPMLGALIDSLFVPVRVDRDERPDVAERYQAAVQSLAGLRGYPLTVFLTPDGSAFFGGTYFPADDPVTGRGLKQILPEVARSYREQRQFILQHAALVRQLAVAKSAVSHGVLQPATIRFEIGVVRAALAAAVATRSALGSFAHTQAMALLLAEYGRTNDTSFLRVATAALDFLVDSAGVAGGGERLGAERDDPPGLVGAGVLRNLAVGWALTAEPRYRDAARALAQELAHELGGGGGAGQPAERAVFADREAYVIGSLLEAAPAVGEPRAAERALAALDSLLRRVYARGRGVRHAARGAASAEGLLQDQVQVAAACLAAYGFTGERRYLAAAEDLAALLEREFADPLGGYFDAAPTAPAAPALTDRTKEVLDDLLPGANAWAARFLLQLAEATGDVRYRRRAEAALEAFAGAIAGQGVRASSYLAAAGEALGRGRGTR